MGRTFSLRGSLTAAQNGIFDKEIFDYQSPARTIAWKLVRAHIWVVNYQDATTSSNGDRCSIASTLFTDTPPATSYSLDPDDNRSIGWGQLDYLTRDTDDFMLPQGGLWPQSEMILDPDHKITKELHLRIAALSDTATSPELEIAYLIILEEEKISPAESVLFQIKGMGQDLDN